MAKHRKYSKEFKLQTAKLVTEQGFSYDQAAKQVGATAKKSSKLSEYPALIFSSG